MPAVSFQDMKHLLQLYPVSPMMTDEQLAEFATHARIDSVESVRFFICQRFRASTKAMLERLGVAYADSKGSLHIPISSMLVHIESPSQGKKTANAKTQGLGPAGVRAVQALLASTKELSIVQLASVSGLSIGQTHTVYRVLEEAGLVESTGRGNARRRTLLDRGAVLDWLSAQSSARRREPYLDVALYARRPEELWTRIGATLSSQGLRYAITGAAGSALYGASPTAVPVTSVRIDSNTSLDSAACVLGAETTTRGANIRLLRDTGLVGVIASEARSGVFVAPKVRVYLDALAERRGEDIAQYFRETILGY
jgi:hypothetical protein